MMRFMIYSLIIVLASGTGLQAQTVKDYTIRMEFFGMCCKYHIEIIRSLDENLFIVRKKVPKELSEEERNSYLGRLEQIEREDREVYMKEMAAISYEYSILLTDTLSISANDSLLANMDNFFKYRWETSLAKIRPDEFYVTLDGYTLQLYMYSEEDGFPPLEESFHTPTSRYYPRLAGFLHQVRQYYMQHSPDPIAEM